MEIVDLSEDRISNLGALFFEFWPEDTTLEKEIEECQKILNNKEEKAFLLKEKGRYIGFAHASIRHEYVDGKTSPFVAYLEGIYIQKAYQNMGLGKRLVEKIEQWAISMGCTQIGSDTEIENESSIGFHKHLGYKETGKYVSFIKNLQAP